VVQGIFSTDLVSRDLLRTCYAISSNGSMKVDISHRPGRLLQVQ
jgi:hypothetical protein